MTMRGLLIFLLVVIILSACAQNPPQKTQNAVAMLDLSGVELDSVQSTPAPKSTATTAPTATIPATHTATIPITKAADSQSTQAPINLPIDSPTPSCTNHATLVKNLNVSDNTAFRPGTHFAKVWLVNNSGSCTWTPGYSLVFQEGNLISETPEIFFTEEVAPGEDVELRINFMAPIDPQTYASNWYLKDENGGNFGIGPAGNETLHVQIVVRHYGTPIIL